MRSLPERWPMDTQSNPQTPGPPTRSGSKLLVSFLIVNYNGAQLLHQCLRSLEAHTKFRTPHSTFRTGSEPPHVGCYAEVIVVENGSTDDSLQILNQFPWVKIVRSERNRGFAGGNNLGLAHCSGKY